MRKYAGPCGLRPLQRKSNTCTKYRQRRQRMHEISTTDARTFLPRILFFNQRLAQNAHVPINPAFWRQDGCYNFRIYTRLHKRALKMFFVQFSVVTSNSPSRLDVGFITLKSDANVKSRQHEYNGSDQERLRICR